MALGAKDVNQRKKSFWLFLPIKPNPSPSAALPFHEVEVLALQPSESLDALAQAHVHELPPPVHRVLEGLGALKGSGAALSSYLLFEPGFLRALMALGAKDVNQRKEELLAFFAD